MLTRRFGRTELPLSVFSCGGMRFQDSWNRNARVSPAGQQNLEATVDRARAIGINHFETARGYGTSEAQLGPALARHARASFYLQTKLRPLDDPAQFEAALEESLRNLGTSYLDLFAFHGLNTPACLARTFGARGCYAVADRWRKEGRIRHIGFSTHGPTPLILEAVETGAFDYVNLHYYYILQDNHPVLAAARRRDLGVFIISPSDKGGRLYRAPAKLRALCAPLSPLVFNDLWCLAHPEIHTLSVGAARPSDFDEHLEALPLVPEAAAQLAPIVARLERAYSDALGADYARTWRHGLRSHAELPRKINVEKILWLDNLVRAYDLVEFAQERYAAMDPDDHWVPGARATRFRDADLIAALPESPLRNELPRLLREAHARLHNRSAVAGP